MFFFRYSTMLAENLVDAYKPVEKNSSELQMGMKYKDVDEDNTNEPKEVDVGG